MLNGNAKQRTVAVGQNLLTMGYGGIWQHPDFNYDSGFTGSGTEEVGTHAPNSFHKFDEALDIGVQANGHHKLETLYQYLNKNRKRFGIAELFYDLGVIAVILQDTMPMSTSPSEAVILELCNNELK